MLVNVAPEHLEGWAEELASLTVGLGNLFARPEPREVFADLIEGLLVRQPADGFAHHLLIRRSGVAGVGVAGCHMGWSWQRGGGDCLDLF
ncbi:hypothetical protein GCM10009753_76980 [Streptantibioticus ferralitis]|uniref:Uncharacterized protein n=1 Tax=Streptantibioticus ferralitis TaxID=236510 RepID=A0ABT5ZC47_9ACTN|nr:hypothetical protein [Streptantibioticus ferralitis]MDF2261136.1 hypothetical protein [Streptantibioticus ferralitis]